MWCKYKLDELILPNLGSVGQFADASISQSCLSRVVLGALEGIFSQEVVVIFDLFEN